MAGYSLMGAAMNFLQSMGMRKQEKNALFLGFLAGANQIWSAVLHTINENWFATGLGYFFGIGILIFSYIAWKNWQ
ncbi:MAG: hypothetical protein IH840_00915 [Candidatus Heimdallarchaeota archaeon]|nr:hypothetical protein [Candidatus Heimdallarchaeota archaeon]